MRALFLLWFVFLIANRLIAQDPVKKVLTHEDYAGWKVIEQETISNDGTRVAFNLAPQQGDGNLLLVNLLENRVDTMQRGCRATFGPENDFLVYHIQPPVDSVKAAKRKKLKKEEMPADSLGVLIFPGRVPLKFPKLKSYKVPEENGRWIAFLTTPEEKKDTSAAGRKSKPVKQPGDDLVLLRVKDGKLVTFSNVVEYFYARKGGAVVFVREQKDSVATTSELVFFNTASGSVSKLFAGEGWIKKAVTDEAGQQIGFLHSKDTTSQKVYSLYLGQAGVQLPEKVVDGYTSGIPVGWTPSENGNLFFSEDGVKLYLGTAPSPRPEPKDSLLEEEKPRVDVWSWQDKILQPQQKVEADKEKKRTWLAVYHTDLKRFVQLGDPAVRDIGLVAKGNGEIALGTDATPYLRAESWTGRKFRDFYTVDLKSGIKRMLVKEKVFAQLSPGGKYVVWYEPADSSFYAQSTDINNLEVVPLTQKIPVNFFNEENDLPAEPFPYGIAGWTAGDKFVFIYDRYDIWKLDPAGVRVPVCVTQAFGRRNHTRLRYIKTDPREEFLPVDKSSLLSAFDERTMSAGFFAFDFGTVKEPSLLLMDKYHFGTPRLARNSGLLLWTRENISEFPNLWVSDTRFKAPRKISDANPGQSQFNWTTVEMVEWSSFSGETLKGLLYKPENFNPLKKYPMIVYYYERNSELIFRHIFPTPSRSTINRTFYASNGYLVFVPDITYQVGYPGQSAYDAVVSGTTYLTNRFPWIDKARIGLQGQSWGGYQTAWLITRTDLFAAGMAGAPVSNMTSAYGGIRWETGISRMYQYEQTQSRIGGTLWEKPLLYIENSPLFFVPKIKTPLLIMHNDNDGAVPWYQGIELFTALRRLDKPAWMLTYNNEPHNLNKESWANRMDLDKRMFQFFNHYLKDQPMPDWMKYGIPAVEKGKTLGY